MDMFKKLAQQLKEANAKSGFSPMALPFGEEFLTPKNEFLHKMTQKAVELYERKSDINHFSKLVLSDPENTTHNDLVNELFNSGVVDPFVDDKLDELADNKKLLKDLGLI